MTKITTCFVLRGFVLRAAVVLSCFAAACRTAPPSPAVLDTQHEMCRTCRMVVSDARAAAQIVAPNDEPVFFDNLDCLSAFLKDAPLKTDALVYVADHRTKDWVRADQAVYTRVDGIRLPMDSHVIAHASTSSRDADPAAAGGTPVAVQAILPGMQMKGAS